MKPEEYLEEVDGNRMYREVKSNQMANFIGKSVGSNIKKNEVINNIKSAFDAKNLFLNKEQNKSMISENDSNTFVAEVNAVNDDKTQIDTTNTDISMKFKLNLNDLTKNTSEDPTNNIPLETPKQIQLNVPQTERGLVDSQNK